jgi:hypothetical protein
MKRIAVAQARARLERARTAVAAIKAAEGAEGALDAIVSAWADYLLAANSIFSKLEQGAKSNNKSKAWFGRIKNLRKTDDLLKYLHQARNVEEHGLNSSIQMSAPHLEFVSRDYRLPPERRGKDLLLRLPNGTLAKMTMPDRMSLTEIVDERFGDRFDPPRSHMGKPFPAKNKIYDAAALALDTIETFIQEAEALISD